MNWWTDVAVPLSAALIGGGFALIGGWLGAKWAAKEQGKYARQIDAGRRRDRLESEAILGLDEILQRLSFRAQANEDQWERNPAQMGEQLERGHDSTSG